MDKLKVLFQRDHAENTKTGEVAEIIFQHFSRPFNFKDPKNSECLKAINEYRQKKFGPLKPSMEGNIKAFNGKEVWELVIDGTTVFERSHFKIFNDEKWNPNKLEPLEPKRKWKRLTSEQSEIVKDVSAKVHQTLGASLRERCPVDLDVVATNVANDSRSRK